MVDGTSETCKEWSRKESKEIARYMFTCDVIRNFQESELKDEHRLRETTQENRYKSCV